MPFVDGFNIAENHSVLAIFEVFRHRDLGLPVVFRLSHEFYVFTTLLQIVDVYLLGLHQLLQPVLSLLDGLFHRVLVQGRRRRCRLRSVRIITALSLV